MNFSEKAPITVAGWMIIAWLAMIGPNAGSQAPPSSGSATPAPSTFTQSVPESDAQAPTFEVASVRQNPPGSSGLTSINESGTRFAATNATLELLVEIAYAIPADRILGAPSWFDSDQYEVIAKAEGEKSLTSKQLMPLLRQLLKDRFHLAVHNEMKDLPGYALVVAKDGAKLKAGKDGAGQAQIIPGQLLCSNCSLYSLAATLAILTERPVVDKTGIHGLYAIQVNFAPENETDSPLPSIFTALQEQLGLKLVPQRVPSEMLVVDHVGRVPTEN